MVDLNTDPVVWVNHGEEIPVLHWNSRASVFSFENVLLLSLINVKMSMSLLNPYLDLSRPITKTGHHLPHWHQDNKTQFVTFRLADSLPQSVLRELKKLRSNFFDEHPLPWDKELKSLYNGIISEKQQYFLDQGLGSCILKIPEIRQMLVESIEFYNEKKYKLISYVIMPNHVHILFSLIPPYSTDTIIGNIKRYSSIRINKETGNVGNKLWAENYWDTLIRSYRHLSQVINYIEQNPSFLSKSDYYLFSV
ncbi:MAG: transposase [Muribaculaceae bacterium]|nr:transposase [Muribaculaceae bacterium]